MQDLLTFWYDTLLADLKAYRDAGTDTSINLEGTTFSAHWQTQDKPREALFRLEPNGDFRWLSESGPLSYRDFLASPDVSNLKQFSSATRRRFNQIDHLRYFVSPPCLAEEADSQVEQAVEAIRVEIDEALSLKAGRTKVIFIKGDAGAGKTTLLQYLTFKQAELYANAATDFQFLFVSAQGRALSNIKDALAAELKA